MGRYGAGTRNKEGSMVVDFGKRMDLAIVNTYFKKKDEHRVTHKSGGTSTQVDCVICQEELRQEVTRILGGKDELPDEWDKTAEMLRKTVEIVLGVTFGK